MKRTLTGLAIIIALAGLSGCQRSQSTLTSPVAKVSAVKDRHYCNARTKNNTPCHHLVKNEGDRCPLHQGKEAIPENWATVTNCATDLDCEKQAELVKELKSR